MSLLEDLERNWEAFGKADPLWAILTLPGTENRRWDEARFFETGRQEIATAFARLDRLGFAVKRGRALDFGCGVGRLTQALADRFAETHGVDIADSMIQIAQRSNRRGTRCRYHVNAKDDLSLFEDATFDFIYSTYVLQHVPPPLAERYVAELVRVLTAGGILMLQMTEEPVRIEAMPEGAHRARVELASAVPTLHSGEGRRLQVLVANESAHEWPHVNAGNHWLSPDGTTIAFDDGRSPLSPLSPGEHTAVELFVTAPREPGDYLLEVDLVEEGITWFAGRGSIAARVAVRVLPGKASAPSPRMEMHGVPRDEVRRWVERAGGRFLVALEPFSYGIEFLKRDWVSWTYVVTR